MVVMAMFVLFALVTSLGIMIAMVGSNARTERALEAERLALHYAILHAERDIQFFETREFVEMWALREMGFVADGRQVWEAR